MTDARTQLTSLWEIRRQIRQLPRDRQREMASAIREGRAVSDPRDARLTAAWAEALAAKASRIPQWLLPLAQRPQGWRARVWFLHLAWVVAAVAYAYYTLWRGLKGTWHWVLLGFLIYVALSLPMTFRTMRRMLRAYWNAPVAASANRELARTRK